MHLTEARLAEADHTPDERAHLQSCVRCRLAARRLNTFLDDTPPSMVWTSMKSVMMCSFLVTADAVRRLRC